MATPAFQIQNTSLQVTIGSFANSRSVVPAKDLAGAAVDLTSGYTFTLTMQPNNPNPFLGASTQGTGVTITGLTTGVQIDYAPSADAQPPATAGSYVLSASNDAGTTWSTISAGRFTANIA